MPTNTSRRTPESLLARGARWLLRRHLRNVLWCVALLPAAYLLGTNPLEGLLYLAVFVAVLRLYRRTRTGRETGRGPADYSARNVAAGRKAEGDVAAALRTIPGVLEVLTNVDLGRNGDCDIVAICETGVAAIEVKAGAGGGQVRWTGRALMSGNGATIHGSPNPLDQCSTQAELLNTRLGRPVRGIVCIPSMTGRPFTVRGVTVCNTHALSDIVTDLPGRRVTPRLAARTARQLRG